MKTIQKLYVYGKKWRIRKIYYWNGQNKNHLKKFIKKSFFFSNQWKPLKHFWEVKNQFFSATIFYFSAWLTSLNFVQTLRWLRLCWTDCRLALECRHFLYSSLPRLRTCSRCLPRPFLRCLECLWLSEACPCACQGFPRSCYYFVRCYIVDSIVKSEGK